MPVTFARIGQPIDLTQLTVAPDYVCAACREPIDDDDIHTGYDREDYHPGCCPVCRSGLAGLGLVVSDQGGERVVNPGQ